MELPNYRKRRYLGDDLCLPVSEFTEPDQERIRQLYVFLEEMFALLAKDDLSPEKLARVSEFSENKMSGR